MLNFIASLLIAFWGTYISIKLLKPIAIKYQFVDKPDERKCHNGMVPLIGGVAIYIGFLLSMIVMDSNNAISLKHFIIATGGILIVGIMDDKYNLSVRFRMVCQLLAASVMMFAANEKLEYLGNLFALGDVYLDWFSVPFTYLAILGAINAFNMADGIDGLMGGLTLNTMLFLTFFFSFAGRFYESWICLSLITTLCAFMLFNLTSFDNPKLTKVFMGDAGSMFLGFSIVWMLSIGTQGEDPAFRPVTALWIIAIPLMDMVGVMIRRQRNGKSPFKPDRDHLHHIFMKAGFTPRQSLLSITTLSFLISAIGFALEFMAAPEIISLTLFLMLFGLYLFALKHIQGSVKILEKVKSIIKFHQRYFNFDKQ
jgi:UDP-GlcNAc:undecaprenyl-phosphate/decaprenyl-phosphate GlcNAc-1-phosphate transferase